MKKLLLATLAGIVLAGSAQAQTTDKSSNRITHDPYLGVGVTLADNTTTGGRNGNPKLFGGVGLADNWGVEWGYSFYTTRDFSRTNGAQTVTGSTRGLSGYVAGTYTLPVNEHFSLIGKLGLASSYRKYDNNLGMRYKDEDRGVYAALGAEFKLTEKVSVVAELEHQGKSKWSGARNDVASVSMKFGF